MNFEIIATQAVALLTPYLAKGAEEISKTAAKDLWEKIKTALSKRNKEGLANKLSTSPDNKKTQGQIELILEEEIEKSPELCKELEGLIEGLKQQTFSSNIEQSGDDNIAVGGQINNSSINIKK